MKTSGGTRLADQCLRENADEAGRTGLASCHAACGVLPASPAEGVADDLDNYINLDGIRMSLPGFVQKDIEQKTQRQKYFIESEFGAAFAPLT